MISAAAKPNVCRRPVLILDKLRARIQGNKLAVAVLGIWALAAVAVFVMPKHLPNWDDLHVYLDAGKKAAQHHTVYDVQGHYQFKYAPVVALAFAPLAAAFDAYPGLVPQVFYAVLLILWCLFLGRLGLDSLPERRVSIYLLASAWLVTVPLRDELKLGQVNLIPVALLAWVYVVRGRPALQGLALAIAILFKLYAVLAIPFLALKGRWQTLGWALFWGLLSNFGLVGLYSGFDFARGEVLAWWQTLSESTATLLPQIHNVSWTGFLARMFGAGSPVSFFLWLLPLLAWLAFRWKARKKTDGWDAFAIDLGAIFVLNPLVWPYWTLFLAPLVWFALKRELERVRLSAYSLFWVSAFVLCAGLQNKHWVLWGFLPMSALAFWLQEMGLRAFPALRGRRS